MAELADALDSGSSDFTVIQVQVLLSAPSPFAFIDTISAKGVFFFTVFFTKKVKLRLFAHLLAFLAPEDGLYYLLTTEMASKWP